MAQTVAMPTMQEIQVQSQDREDPLEKGMATHFSILAWRIPWMEEPGGLQSMGSQRIHLISISKSNPRPQLHFVYIKWDIKSRDPNVRRMK